ncbi:MULTISPECIES: hypothetical protein [Nitrosopumilus]|uniref:Uncharacterized protein n=1 Tax=Nitrosopumilus piranensis TaxID=1582439 RepID=A0A0C5BW75_9ARCH|nr:MULTISPECIES: hypothetical protein [Nitrosopumilus]AJM92521.1 hypothetical protein NPIRD3C_1309 [Nitrosopumilus piranensis]KAF6244410.1 hypothetical protein C6989_09045 [Nitrosopumilus sp. b2]
MSDQLKPWVIVSSISDDASEQDIDRIRPQIISLVDNWQSSNGTMWSGSFSGKPSGMAVFEATEQEAKKFYDEYSKVCGDVLVHHMYQWDAMPILSVLSK